MPLREMFDMLKKEGKNPKDYVNNVELKKIKHQHIIKSIQNTKKRRSRSALRRPARS